MWMKCCSAGKGKVLTYRSAVYHKKAIVAMHARASMCVTTPNWQRQTHIVLYSVLCVCVCVCVQHMVSKEENLYKQTWQHPKSRKWHCIDCACINDEGTPEVMPDVCVKRGLTVTQTTVW